MTSMGQGEPAMMPVRSEREVEFAEARVLQFGDEHGGHAVHGRAALLGDGLERGQRVKVFAPESPWPRRAPRTP